MAAKHLLFRSSAQEKVLRGVSQLADAVRVTLGPTARAILIERKWGRPLVSDDGVTIAKEFELEDPERIWESSWDGSRPSVPRRRWGTAPPPPPSWPMPWSARGGATWS